MSSSQENWVVGGVRRSERKRKNVNYNENSNDNNSQLTNSQLTKKNNACTTKKKHTDTTDVSYTMTVREFNSDLKEKLKDEYGEGSSCVSTYRSTFIKHTQRVLTEEDQDKYTINDLLSPKGGHIFQLPVTTPQEIKKNKNLNTAVEAVRKCFQNEFDREPENTEMTITSRRILQSVECKSDNTLEGYIAKQYFDNVIDNDDEREFVKGYFNYRTKHRQNKNQQYGKWVHDRPYVELQTKNQLEYRCEWTIIIGYIKEIYIDKYNVSLTAQKEAAEEVDNTTDLATINERLAARKKQLEEWLNNFEIFINDAKRMLREKSSEQRSMFHDYDESSDSSDSSSDSFEDED